MYIYLYEIYLLSCFRFGQNVGISFETRRTPRNQDINKRVYKFNALGFSMVARGNKCIGVGREIILR